MTREELLLAAKSDQAHTALEEAVAPLEILPTDLLALMVDSRGNPYYRIEGFVMRTVDEHSHYLNGEKVEIDLIGSMCQPGFWSIKGPDYDRTFTGRCVPAQQIEVRSRDYPAWFAVVRGNGIILERELRARGFASASNGSPAYCRVREATQEEKEEYRKV